MIDYSELFEKSKKLAEDSGLTQLELYQRFMFERILERISVSKYNENFILKGGLLLSAMLGINSRSTRDMDISIKGIDVSQEKMLKILNEILSIDIDDKVKFEVVNITDIRADDEYGGNKYHLVGRLENLKVSLEIDISTGDEITPKELNFEYISIFDNKKIYIGTYNIETILSEKIETILRRGKYNTRMKDYYDLYYFATYKWKDIDINTLKSAIHTTFNHRNSEEYLKRFNTIIKNILEDETLTARWNKYRKEHEYAKEIEFNDTIKAIKKIYAGEKKELFI